MKALEAHTHDFSKPGASDEESVGTLFAARFEEPLLAHTSPTGA
jgi:hypothetical protein